MYFWIEPFSLLWFVAGIITSWALEIALVFIMVARAQMGQKKIK